MAKAKTKDPYKLTLKQKISEIFKKHGNAVAVFTLLALFAGGVYLLGAGLYGYNKATKENLVVAGIKAMQEGDFHKAQTYLVNAGKNNTPEAFPFLAWISAKTGNFPKALDYARDCARYPNIYGANEIMGYLALLGYGNAKGAGSAIFYFNEALKGYTQEYIDEHNPLLRMYENSIPLVMNTQDYIRMVNESVKIGSKEALLYRGDIEFLGEENDLSPNSAAKSWEDAIKNGVIEAQTREAGLLWHGYGRRRDLNEAYRLFENAAKQDEPVANYSLGLIKLRQGDIAPNGEAMTCLRHSARKNYGPALTAVGVMALFDHPNSRKFAYACADIFKQAYDNGDSTGGVLYSMMLLTGFGTPANETDAFSILYDIKNRGVEPVENLLKYFTYNNRVDDKQLLWQMIGLFRAMYLGQLAFNEGDPGATDYITKQKDSTIRFYTSQLEDDITKDQRLNQIYKNNIVKEFADPKKVGINGKALMFNEMYQLLETYNPTGGAKKFVPKLIYKLNPLVPTLPKSYSKYKLDLDEIENKL